MRIFTYNALTRTVGLSVVDANTGSNSSVEIENSVRLEELFSNFDLLGLSNFRIFKF